jgi:hypothetical protein
MHVVGEAGDDHALDQLVRVLVHDLPVLERARLGFVGVANQVNRLAALAVHEAPFQAAGKTRAAAAAQAGNFTSSRICSCGEIFLPSANPWRQGERLFQRLIAAVAQIAFDVRRVTRFIGVFQNQFVFLRHSNLTLKKIL